MKTIKSILRRCREDDLHSSQWFTGETSADPVPLNCLSARGVGTALNDVITVRWPCFCQFGWVGAQGIGERALDKIRFFLMKLGASFFHEGCEWFLDFNHHALIVSAFQTSGKSKGGDGSLGHHETFLFPERYWS